MSPDPGQNAVKFSAGTFDSTSPWPSRSEYGTSAANLRLASHRFISGWILSSFSRCHCSWRRARKVRSIGRWRLTNASISRLRDAIQRHDRGFLWPAPFPPLLAGRNRSSIEICCRECFLAATGAFLHFLAHAVDETTRRIPSVPISTSLYCRSSPDFPRSRPAAACRCSLLSVLVHYPHIRRWHAT